MPLGGRKVRDSSLEADTGRALPLKVAGVCASDDEGFREDRGDGEDFEGGEAMRHALLYVSSDTHFADHDRLSTPSSLKPSSTDKFPSSTAQKT